MSAVTAHETVSALDRSDPLPLWAQLLTVLRRRIDAGDYREGFPTDAKLAAEFDLSRHTVREAVRRLQDDGVVDRRRGIGTFVSPLAVEHSIGTMYSLFRSIEAQGRSQRSDLLDLSTTADADVATRLALPAHADLVRVERLRRVDGEPLAHDVSWLPVDVARPLLDVDFTHTALYDELARTCGVHVDSGTEWIQATAPGKAERDLLGMRQRGAVLRIERLVRAAGRPIEWRRTIVRGDVYTIVAQWSPTVRYNSVLAPTEVER